MKRIALTSMTCLISTVAFADQGVYVPTLEGGLTASVGTFYATPSTGNYNYANTNGQDPFTIEGIVIEPHFN
ncbi:MAG: hypothetical protein ABSF18_05255, partial [Gammaproteobacteria bacterium]